MPPRKPKHPPISLNALRLRILANRSFSNDRLTNLPSEIIIKIVAKLPLYDFLNITQTSKRLQTVVKQNASTICNLIITGSSSYYYLAYILQATFDKGWIVPSHPRLLLAESILAGNYKGIRFLRFSDPGPQFLYMIEIVAEYVYKNEARVWMVDICKALKEINGHNMRGSKATMTGARAQRSGKIRKLIWYYGV